MLQDHAAVLFAALFVGNTRFAPARYRGVRRIAQIDSPPPTR